MNKRVVAVVVCTLLAMLAACVRVPAIWHMGPDPGWIWDAKFHWYNHRDRVEKDPLRAERRHLLDTDPQSPRIAEIDLALLQPVAPFKQPPGPTSAYQKDWAAVHYTWFWRAALKPNPVGGEVGVVYWPWFVPTQAFILLLGGGLLTYVVRRERRRRADTGPATSA